MGRKLLNHPCPSVCRVRQKNTLTHTPTYTKINKVEKLKRATKSKHWKDGSATLKFPNRTKQSYEMN